MENKYEKLFEDENIQIGDIIIYHPQYNKVSLSQTNRYQEQFGHTEILGICTQVNDNYVTITNEGVCDVNIYGMTCIGDKLTIGSIPGKAVAIKYVHDEEILFRKRSIGKVINLYDTYEKAKVLLDIK